MKQHSLLVIGGSAGSLPIVLSILKGVGRDYPLPILIVLHRTPSFDSSLEELLSTRTLLSIKEVEEKEPLVPAMVYICPADYHVLVEEDHTTSLDYSEKVNFSRPSIDVTFRSAADVFGPALVALLLSGGNADGAEGMACVKEKGGFTVVQDPSTAEVPYMPQQVLMRMDADAVVPAEGLPAFIRQLGRG